MSFVARWVACVLLLALPVEASRLVYFKLPSEGTAGVVLADDFKGKPLRAVLIDGGGGGDSGLMGIRLGELSLFEWLEERGYRELVVLCSHPHRDHLGGLKAATRAASTFIGEGGRPRFDKVIFIDSTVGDRLAPEYDQARVAAKKAGVKLPKATYQSAENRDAFLGLVDQASSSVRIATWKYKPEGKPHPHGRSIITIVEFLDREGNVVRRHVDLDDADQALTERFVEAMSSAGEQLDSFTAPHHMSDSTNDISRLLALSNWEQGRRPLVIATVNEENRFDHPGPKNLFLALRAGHDVQLTRDGAVVLTETRVIGSTSQEQMWEGALTRLGIGAFARSLMANARGEFGQGTHVIGVDGTARPSASAPFAGFPIGRNGAADGRFGRMRSSDDRTPFEKVLDDARRNERRGEPRQRSTRFEDILSNDSQQPRIQLQNPSVFGGSRCAGCH